MADSLRFHLDENVHGAVANGLQLRGIDATTAHDVGLIGASDEEHLAFALSQTRVLVTHDDDFLRLASSGVPVCRVRSLARLPTFFFPQSEGLVDDLLGDRDAG
jgi:hypothetical protein